MGEPRRPGSRLEKMRADMDDDVDRALEALKVHIKKEIVDNYFADRVYLEEDTELLHQELEAYTADLARLGKRFQALYQALGSQKACAQMMEVLAIQDWPFYREYCSLSAREQQDLLKDTRRRGLTAYRRFRNLIFDLYERLQRESVTLQEAYTKIQTHLRLLNEDIDKFNLSYDFGLIAAQIEAMEGGREGFMTRGMLAPEREELSTRMRFKHQKLTDEQLPPVPALPPLAKIKGKLEGRLAQIYRAQPGR
jgi:Arc/MetJ family transcription regulator